MHSASDLPERANICRNLSRRVQIAKTQSFRARCTSRNCRGRTCRKKNQKNNIQSIIIVLVELLKQYTTTLHRAICLLRFCYYKGMHFVREVGAFVTTDCINPHAKCSKGFCGAGINRFMLKLERAETDTKRRRKALVNFLFC